MLPQNQQGSLRGKTFCAGTILCDWFQKFEKCVMQLYNKQMRADGYDLITANSITAYSIMANQYFLLLPIGL